MIEQEITIQLSEDPFDTKTVKLKLPKGVKLLSSEPYAIDMLKDYGIDIEGNNNDDKSYNNVDAPDGAIMKGIIHSVSEDYALVNIGSKFTAVCYTTKEPKEISEQLKPNMIVDVKIKTKTNGEIIASISDALAEVKKAEILESIGNKSVGYKCKVKELIHGGYWVEISGIRCFMPGSLGGINKLHDFNSLIGKELIVMPITYSREKNTIVVSHREYLKTLIPTEIDDLRANTKEYIIGKVTGTTTFGIFAEFNECLTGLIPKDEISESLKEFESRTIKPGDSIKFWVKDIINQNKIILTQHGAVEDPWDDAGKKYPPMTNVIGKVTKKTKYGVFIQLEKGISGLLHKSELNDKTLNKGDSVEVIIRSINPSERKISMGLS